MLDATYFIYVQADRLEAREDPNDPFINVESHY